MIDIVNLMNTILWFIAIPLSCQPTRSHVRCPDLVLRLDRGRPMTAARINSQHHLLSPDRSLADGATSTRTRLLRAPMSARRELASNSLCEAVQLNCWIGQRGQVGSANARTTFFAVHASPRSAQCLAVLGRSRPPSTPMSCPGSSLPHRRRGRRPNTADVILASGDRQA